MHRPRIDPDKDVDGFHPVNAGRLAIGLDALVPCTPLGCLDAAASRSSATSPGSDAVVIGRSNIVGKPMAQLLLGRKLHRDHRPFAARATCPTSVRRADIVVAAVGRPEMVRGDWLKPGATVIDVGINRVAQPTTARASWSATSLSTKPPRSPARSRRCPAASGR